MRRIKKFDLGGPVSASPQTAFGMQQGMPPPGVAPMMSPSQLPGNPMGMKKGGRVTKMANGGVAKNPEDQAFLDQMMKNRQKAKGGTPRPSPPKSATPGSTRGLNMKNRLSDSGYKSGGPVKKMASGGVVIMDNNLRDRMNRVTSDRARERQAEVARGYRSDKIDDAIKDRDRLFTRASAMSFQKEKVKDNDASARGAVGIRGGVGSQSGHTTPRNPSAAIRARRMGKTIKDVTGMASGGSVRGDGCATKGKTKGRSV
jgi:hypothetical protein